MSLKPRRLRNNCKSNKCIRDDTKAAARQSPKCIKKIKYGEKRFSIWRTELLHPATWHDHDIDFTRWLYPAMWRGSGITTANSPSDSTLQCDTWLWDDMALNSPVAAPCNVARSYGITTLNSPGDSTLQCGRWLWDDMKWNSLKRPPYWNSTSDFEFDHITTVDMSFCTSLRNFIQIGPPSAEKINVIPIFKMADISNLEF